MTIARFRLLVCLQTVLLVWYWTLPPEPRQREAGAFVSTLIRPSIELPTFASYGIVTLSLVAAVGLLSFQRWSRALLLGIIAFNLVYALFSGVSVSFPFQAFLGGSAGILRAMIAALSYWSPVSERFGHPEPAQPPDPSHTASLISVFETTNPALVPVIESVLREADIRFVVPGGQLQHLVAGGELGGLNPALGPSRFLVRSEDVEQARAILSTFAEADGPGQA